LFDLLSARIFPARLLLEGGENARDRMTPRAASHHAPALVLVAIFGPGETPAEWLAAAIGVAVFISRGGIGPRLRHERMQGPTVAGRVKNPETRVRGAASFFSDHGAHV